MKERNNLDKFISDLNKEFGDGTVMKLDGMHKARVDVISTGSYSLDRALGVGGLPRGRIIEIYGPESSGKTTLALSVIAQAQKAGGQAVFIDAEHALDPEYAERIGVKLDSLAINQPDSGEDALNLALKFIQSGTVDVIVIDSVAALTPRAELEGDVGKQQVGAMARMMGQALRKMTALAAKANVTVIFINQLRMMIGTLPFMNPETTPGGRALKFSASVRIEIRRTGKVKDKEEVVGNTTRAKVAKNKVSVPFKTAEFSLVFGEGIDYELDVLTCAITDEVVKKDGNTYIFGEERLGVGLGNARNALKNDPELFKRLLSSMGTEVITGPAEVPGTYDEVDNETKKLSKKEKRKMRKEKGHETKE